MTPVDGAGFSCGTSCKCPACWSWRASFPKLRKDHSIRSEEENKNRIRRRDGYVPVRSLSRSPGPVGAGRTAGGSLDRARAASWQTWTQARNEAEISNLSPVPRNPGRKKNMGKGKRFDSSWAFDSNTE